ncbi:MAG TPA: nucleotidyltransferase domain-containing protein, partial [Candidatus Brocadiaceae bacterium]|nr:nucleotidyltransferase domain-containing protein [Candidatus Brocadiaceae bacterium]
MRNDLIIKTVRFYYPDISAIYLFGSYGTEYERIDSDVDIALLLPVLTAKAAGRLSLSACWSELASLAERSVDLINLRLVNTVFQHEIIQKGTILFKAADSATDVFEMITMSLYQKLNEERKD